MTRRCPYPTATCWFCRRSRPLPKLRRRDDGEYECRDEVSCSEAKQWAEGGDDGH